MSAVAVLLIAVGIADGWRRLSRAVWPPLVTGPVVIVACAAVCGLWHARDIVPLGLAALAAVAWEMLCLRSEHTGGHQRPALAVMVVALAVLIILSGLGSHAGGLAARWAHWVALPLGTVTPTRLLMVVGVVLLQLATGNQLIRLVLGAVGAVRPAGQPQPSDKLKGGRLLGPMERLLILSLGLGGQVGGRRGGRCGEGSHSVSRAERAEGPQWPGWHRRGDRILLGGQLRELVASSRGYGLDPGHALTG
ncbi:hypothetical protein LAUMK35_05261 [Mycobacterium pseudokansasii]|uniref:Uncharacterized protein n=1 Tax=Mycobacterium pseudokansasii TaxID=2341080 RepID=A0A498R1Y1_9MYCO|nr:hypothetical protein LAUMK35_05261 [Mycobacterium pseudokansasii]VBA34244.1 hypothetical protein LAUMK21_05219 [Mycobacterium pseudokansasii]VBA55669.1 hypothetical protein LAUMK142_05197 [Mycobacterium pseudokansasii]